ncbi:MAG TPA: alpha/beta hydrolase [Rhodospirillaceae bacterium]|nr:alpha/beta hydrolase [Rhodospirillaceae bacterium]
MRQKSLLSLGASGFHRLAYREWGDPDNPRVLVCVHGLTRNSHDFDYLGRALADEWRVVCPDMPGRGDSEWLDQAEYNFATYRSDCAQLIARLGVDQLDWLGTSMGAVIGMSLAAAANSPIRRLICNDMGPVVPAAALQRIAGYIGGDPRFADLAGAERAFRASMTTFGIRDPEHWRHITESSVKPAGDGTLRLNFDPAVARAFVEAGLDGSSFWEIWDAIRIPVLVIHGTDSDLLSFETAAQMTKRGPPTDLVEIPNCGHAPMLMEVEQIELVRDWIE